jgi:hypothetical protein
MSTIETKVIAATAGSGFGAALSAFLLWIVGVFAFGASSSADQVPKALAAVPEPVGALLAILVAILGAFVGGYAAPHTSRPDLTTLLTPLLGTFTNTPEPQPVDGNGVVIATPEQIAANAAAQAFAQNPPTPPAAG